MIVILIMKHIKCCAKFDHKYKIIFCLFNNYLFIQTITTSNKCYYKRDHPYLQLAPIKFEILNTDPLLIMYRNVITDREMSAMKHLTTNSVDNYSFLLIMFNYSGN